MTFPLPNGEKPLLSLRKVSYRYHTPQSEIEALREISFDVYPGEFLVLLGPSGCGKTTILSLIAGLITPSEGEIIRGSPEGSSLRIGYMFQHDQLFPWLTVLDNALLSPRIRKEPIRGKRAAAEKLLEEYGLGAFLNSYPRELSGGMRQRAALIRTLNADPDLLLLDEPFSALDYQTRITVSDDIAAIIRHEGKTAVMVTHDVSEALSLADRLLTLTRRPSEVRNVFTVDIPETGALARRASPRFGELYQAVWKEMTDG